LVYLVAAAGAVATAIAAAVLVAEASQAAFEAGEQALTAAGVAAVVAGIAAGFASRSAGDLLLNLAADHAASGVVFANRHALGHAAGSLVRNLLLAADRVGLGLAFRLADVMADLVAFFFPLGLHHANLLGALAGFANLLAHRHALLFPALVRAPHLDGLGARAGFAAGVGAGVAAVLLAGQQTTEPFAKARSALNFMAFIVAMIDALADGLGFGNRYPVLFTNSPLFPARNFHANAANLVPHLGDAGVAGHRSGPRLGDRLTTIGRVRLLVRFLFVNSSRGLVLLGNPLIHCDGAVGRSAGIRGLASVIGADGTAQGCQDTASQQGNSQLLPNHVRPLLHVALRADPGLHRFT